MSGLLGVAAAEFRIAIRNRWVTVLVVLMLLFSLVLSAAGSAPSGELGADRLSVTVASLTGLAVYLIPLMALLLSFDAIAGDRDRGTLALLLTYPLSRPGLLLGKFLAHLTVLGIALLAGYGTAAAAAFATDGTAAAGLAPLFRLFWSSLLLGATFLGIGYSASAMAKRSGTAASMAIGIWLLLIVLFDLALLSAVVADDGGTFTTAVFPWFLLGNPADAFRLFNLAASDATALAAGVAGAASAIPSLQALASLLLWPLLAFFLAFAAFRKVTP
ncbi:MAG TPA: ABC transporter permease subunit [Kiloniellaceae bacterium]|nr:ABC transporter permease subunit [Kiloniellaceae bacterium]